MTISRHVRLQWLQSRIYFIMKTFGSLGLDYNACIRVQGKASNTGDVYMFTCLQQYRRQEAARSAGIRHVSEMHWNEAYDMIPRAHSMLIVDMAILACTAALSI